MLQSVATDRSFTAGQRLFRQGDFAHNLYIVVCGRVKLVRYTIEGRMVVLQIVRRGESLGENTFISNTYSSTAIAEIETRAIAYPQPSLRAALREYPELAEDLSSRLVKKIQSFEISLELLQIRSAHQRLFQYLQYNAASVDGNAVNLDQTWTEIAAELDFAPRTVSRALTRLERDRRITRQAGSIGLQIL
ncbi:MAG: Crp/Fnr family transcriptional regulator [Pleurocapsa sp.]